MDCKKVLYARRAVREYTSVPVPEKTLLELIDAAIQAPSAMNEQPWSFTVVRDKAKLALISRQAKAHLLKTTPAGLVSHHFEEMIGNPKFDIFYNAPALIVISATVQTPWAATDCTLAAENLMLAARDKGLGTCWIGFAQGWLGTPEGKAALGLPDSHIPVAPIIVGQPKTMPPPVARNAPAIRWIG